MFVRYPHIPLLLVCRIQKRLTHRPAPMAPVGTMTKAWPIGVLCPAAPGAQGGALDPGRLNLPSCLEELLRKEELFPIVFMNWQ